MTKAVILAGGRGTRLAPYTAVLPKPLMPIGDLPVIGLLLKQLRLHGVVDVIVAIGHLGSLIQAVIGNGENFGLNVTYSVEREPLGTAGPLRSILTQLDSDFILMNGDLLTTMSLSGLAEHHRTRQADATIAIHRRDIKIDFGLVERDAAGNFTGYVEKPTYTHFVSMGLYMLSPAAIRSLLSREGYLDMPDLILGLHRAGRRVVCYEADCFWLDIGRPEDYRAAIDAYEREPSSFLVGP